MNEKGEREKRRKGEKEETDEHCNPFLRSSGSPFFSPKEIL